MADTFPRSRRPKLGYDPDEVDRFLSRARAAFDGADQSFARSEIRTAAFSMRKGGYSTVHVDAALERLEDAFATRERRRSIEASGAEAWYAEARRSAQEILDRLARPAGRRFDRVAPLATGYRRDEVDAFADRLTAYFQDEEPLSPDEVRAVVFRPQRGGYREAQVDLVLDAVVEVMLAVR